MKKCSHRRRRSTCTGSVFFVRSAGLQACLVVSALAKPKLAEFKASGGWKALAERSPSSGGGDPQGESRHLLEISNEQIAVRQRRGIPRLSIQRGKTSELLLSFRLCVLEREGAALGVHDQNTDSLHPS